MQNLMKNSVMWGLIAIVMSCCHPTPSIKVVTTSTKKSDGSNAMKSDDDRDIHFSTEADEEGLVLEITESTEPANVSPPKTVEGEWLDDETVRKLLNRTGDKRSPNKIENLFAMRKASKPAPTKGKIIEANWTPESGQKPNDSNDKKMTVLRYAPSGKVDIATQISITFSRPMTAVSDGAITKKPPVKMTPKVEGEWEWLGTQTLFFRPTKRLPMATKYQVRIPKGIAAVDGATLHDEISYTFETPPVKMSVAHPLGEGNKLDEPVVLDFDQNVNEKQILEWLGINEAGKPVSFRMAPNDEQEKWRRQMGGNANESHAHRMVLHHDPFKKNTTINVSLKKGAPSAEGPLKTAAAQITQFSTYGPLQVVEVGCGGVEKCRPDDSIYVRFNNALDVSKFKDAYVSVSPNINNMEIQWHGNGLSISGLKEGSTRYTVELKKELTDEHGQHLKTDATYKIVTDQLRPTLIGPPDKLVTLSPFLKKALQVHAVNLGKLKIKIHSVDAADAIPFFEWVDNRRYTDEPSDEMPGKVLHDATAKLKTNDKWQSVTINFEPYLKNGSGQFALWVAPTKQPKNRWDRQEVLVWVQVTDIGVSTFKETNGMLAFVSSLKTGEPKVNAKIVLWPDNKVAGRSDESGLSEVKLGKEGAAFLAVKTDSDMMIHIPGTRGHVGSGRGWVNTTPDNSLSVYSATDRGMYKPGETLHVKGWMREMEMNRAGTVSSRVRPSKKVMWTMTGPQGNEIANGSANLSDIGGFHISTKLPENMNTGRAFIELQTNDSGLAFPYKYRYIYFDVQEFRRPEFEVTTSVSGDVHVLGQTQEAIVSASFYTGEALFGAEVNWTVGTSTASYTPPNHSDFHFGEFNPWWCFWQKNTDGNSHFDFKGMTDADGNHRLKIHFQSMTNQLPANVNLSAHVMDVNRQQWTSSTNILVHPSRRYVGLKMHKNFFNANSEIPVDVVVTDIEGNRTVNDTVLVKLFRNDAHWKDGVRTDTETEVNRCTFQSEKSVHTCHFAPNKGGSYRLEATTKDEKNRQTKSFIRLWVQGDGKDDMVQNKSDTVQLIPDKDIYHPDDMATLLIQSPVYPAEALVTLRKKGIRYKKRIRLNSNSETITVPLSTLEVPAATVQVDVEGVMDKEKNGTTYRKVSTATGNIELKVSSYKNRLDVKVMPKRQVLKPAEKSAIEVLVTDYAGKPVKNAELAIWVVDEAVLALSGYTLKDPMETFFAPMPPEVIDAHSRGFIFRPADLNWLAGMEGALVATQAVMPVMESGVVLADGDGGGPLYRLAPPAPGMARASVPKMKKSGAGGDAAAPILIRSIFDALAFYEPAAITDANGRLRVSFNLPHTLTRYRVMAVAADEANRFGSGESMQTVRLPLMVRPSAPRFLNFGDRFEFPVVVQNTTDTSQQVSVAMRGSNVVMDKTMNALSHNGAGKSEVGKRIDVPANGRVEVRFPTLATNAGKADFVVVAASQSDADSAKVTLPVWTPATTESFATYGSVIDAHVIQSVKAPRDIWTEFGGLTVTTSSTGLQTLTDAFIYLRDYPFECSEQLASKIIAIATLKDVLKAFESEDQPDEAALKEAVQKAIKKLSQRQDWRNGFGMWQRGGISWPFVNVHVAHALVIAKKKGFDVDAQVLENAQYYLTNIEQYLPEWYSLESKQSIRAYAIYVLKKMGSDVTADIEVFLKGVNLKQMPLEAQGWLYESADGLDELQSRLKKNANNSVSETTKTAHFVTEYEDGEYVLMHSNRRVDAIWLNAMLEKDWQNPLVMKLMSGLLAHRKEGRWESTQENAFVLIALDNYFQKVEKVTPDFVTRLWLGDNVTTGHTFKGRTTERHQTTIPMKQIPVTAENLVIEKNGDGRMYYRIGMNYAPKSLQLAAMEKGFAVKREYMSVNNDEDVWRDEKGGWHIKAGARVKVILTMVAPGRRYHVALVDPLPAGLEAVNPALAVQQNVEDVSLLNQRNFWWWHRPWFEHQNMKDERVEAFTTMLWDGVYTYSYEARATTPGEFTVPPAKVHEMYAPETYGRSGTDTVIVK